MNSISRLRTLFTEQQKKLTLNEIKIALDLPAANVSLTLCYFMRKKYCTRELIPNSLKRGRKFIWEYTYII